MLKEALAANGYEVVGEANNGIDAINLYREKSPDIVIMDITMPGMDGVAATKRIIEINPAAKVIICSAENNRAEIFHAMKIGAKDFIMKPFEAVQVIETLRKLALAIC